MLDQFGAGAHDTTDVRGDQFFEQTLRDWALIGRQVALQDAAQMFAQNAGRAALSGIQFARDDLRLRGQSLIQRRAHQLHLRRRDFVFAQIVEDGINQPVFKRDATPRGRLRHGLARFIACQAIQAIVVLERVANARSETGQIAEDIRCAAPAPNGR